MQHRHKITNTLLELLVQRGWE